MTLEKAKLKWSTLIPPKSDEIDCQFNPESLTISKVVKWDEKLSPSFNAPRLKFGGGNPATYKLSLFFDSYSVEHPTDPPKDVRYWTNQLLQLTLRGAGYSMFLVPFSGPPTVTLVWGKITLFTAVVESVQVTFTMFAQDGTPIRAKADVAFKQNELLGDDFIPAQNPTSRSDPRKTRFAHAHQRLDQIAFEEYGDPRYWRLLAEANGLDDPFNLSDGQLLVIPQDLDKG
jgi:Contractile injection system tube protein